eukprot:m.137422 g.137422  ORF g.137422 m.137422 type:complete len:129 (-) comp11705_c0_seq1:163-549(-)
MSDTKSPAKGKAKTLFANDLPEFCSFCGMMLPNSYGVNNVVCNCCNTPTSLTVLDNFKFDTSSRSDAFQRRKYNTTKPQTEEDAVIQETCPKCGREEMTYRTAQLRSADEGQTIFYRCKCGYSFSLNS